jgi:queuine/archaeosine tRNA-ribosyltransferase
LEESRIYSAEKTAKKEGVDGFVIDTLSLSMLEKEIKLKHIQTSLDHLPAEKPKLLYGIHAPGEQTRSSESRIFHMMRCSNACREYFGLTGV